MRSNSFLNLINSQLKLEINANSEGVKKNYKVLLDRNSSRFKLRFENSLFSFCPIAPHIILQLKLIRFVCLGTLAGSETYLFRRDFSLTALLTSAAADRGG